MRGTILWTAAVATALLGAAVAHAHCQIPCGIYDDELRVLMIEEHILTIEKSMNQIRELSAAERPDLNQIARWVANKDQHADELTAIVTYYFMAQRLAPSDLDDPAKKDGYQRKLQLLHRMMVASMKAKPTTDLRYVEQLRALLAEFELAYFGERADRPGP